jgi:hypothetical protein
MFVSCVPEGEGTPQPFYERLGFVSTGAIHPDGEVIMRLDLRT